MLTMYAVASGAKSRPSMPGRKNVGRKTRLTMIVPRMIGLRISLDASKTTCAMGLGLAARRFSPRRR